MDAPAMYVSDSMTPITYRMPHRELLRDICDHDLEKQRKHEQGSTTSSERAVTHQAEQDGSHQQAEVDEQLQRAV